MILGRHSMRTYHFGVCPPLLSVSVLRASLPSRMAQYGSCFPMERLLGRFLARSMMTTSVPISGPSTVMSAKMPEVCNPLIRGFMAGRSKGATRGRCWDRGLRWTQQEGRGSLGGRIKSRPWAWTSHQVNDGKETKEMASWCPGLRREGLEGESWRVQEYC
jgi:hypothetical protein